MYIPLLGPLAAILKLLPNICTPLMLVLLWHSVIQSLFFDESRSNWLKTQGANFWQIPCPILIWQNFPRNPGSHWHFFPSILHWHDPLPKQIDPDRASWHSSSDILHWQADPSYRLLHSHFTLFSAFSS